MCVFLVLMPFLTSFCPPDSKMAVTAPMLNPSSYTSSEEGRSWQQKGTAKIARPELPENVSFSLLVCDWLCWALFWAWAPLVAQSVKNLPAVLETQVQSLGWEDPLEKGMATHSSILTWRSPWTEEPGGLQSKGLQSQTRLKWLSKHTCMRTLVYPNTTTNIINFLILLLRKLRPKDKSSPLISSLSQKMRSAHLFVNILMTN